GLDDLLEVWVDGLDRIDTGLLHAARDRARVRSAIGRDLTDRGAWHVALPGPEGALVSFLAPFVQRKGYRAADRRVLVVVDKPEGQRQHSQVLAALAQFAGSVEMVAVLGVFATQQLIDLCADKKLTLLRFLGPYELRFFVERLNSRAPRHNEKAPPSS